MKNTDKEVLFDLKKTSVKYTYVSDENTFSGNVCVMGNCARIKTGTSPIRINAGSYTLSFVNECYLL